MRRYQVACSVGLAFLAAPSLVPPPVSGVALVQRSDDACRPDGSLKTVPDLVEGSGIAVSSRVPGRVWTHNDSALPSCWRSTGGAARRLG